MTGGPRKQENSPEQANTEPLSPKVKAELDTKLASLTVNATRIQEAGGGNASADPQGLHTRAEKALSILAAVAANKEDKSGIEGPSSGLLTVPKTSALPFAVLVGAALSRSRQAVAAPGAVVKPDAANQKAYDDVIEECEDLRSRIETTIESTKLDKDLHKALDEGIMVGRNAPKTKDQWANELATLETKIDAVANLKPPVAVPEALVDLKAELSPLHAKLKATTPPVGGRKAGAHSSPEVVLAQLVLGLALNELYGAAQSKKNATAARRGELNRTLNPRRRSDAQPAAPTTPEETPAEPPKPPTA